jgi:LmbE family N-acetylglucosaminyl deacetylase
VNHDNVKIGFRSLGLSLVLIANIVLATQPVGILATSRTISRLSPATHLAVATPRAGRVGYNGAVELGQAIRRLGVVASVLHTGAHPDDEDSGLLAYLARGRQARTAYLSLTRGDGGQNLIGPELYELLGVIRTEELLAARRIDGASQFFSRAFDFGFSKSRDETLSKWDREAVLSDIVRVIRTFRPMVIVSQWSGTPTDGHGHHQAAGFLTAEAHRAAADPSRFTEQIAEGLRPWKAKKLYGRAPRAQRESAPSPETTLSINTGQYDPLLGRSYYEIAMHGRSQHRTQDQGALQRRGPQFSRLKILDNTVGAPSTEKDIFQGLDISLTGIAEQAGALGAPIRQLLADAQKAAEEAQENYNPFSTSTVVSVIARGLHRIREARAMLVRQNINKDQSYEIDFLLAQKEQDFEVALAQAQGAVVDCLSNDEIVTPGQTFAINVTVYSDESTKLSSCVLSVPAGWSAVEKARNSTIVDGRAISQIDFQVTVGSDADPTQPYWLENPRKNDMFVPGNGAKGIEPNAPPPVSARVQVEIAGESIEVVQPAQFRFADKALGEIRRELKVSPAVIVNVSPHLLVYPSSSTAQQKELSVSVINNAGSGSQGSVRLEGQGSTAARATFDLKRIDERATFAMHVKRPAANGEVLALAEVNGKSYRQGYQVVSYPHIEPRHVYRDSSVRAELVDVRLAPGIRIGFIEGAGDYFFDALIQLGANVRPIDEQELVRGNLSHYDVVVMGIRTYEVRPDVVVNNGRLLEYVRNGGTLIVQYNKNEYANGNFAPYPIKMKSPPDRVTHESAAVTLIDPNHPRFTFPNRITSQDFEGWVQERGAYFLSEWDSHFQPMMYCNDPGEEAKKGGELIATYGRGQYIYTAYGWFRQLPEGVPGAYRLIANLVSLPKANNRLRR